MSAHDDFTPSIDRMVEHNRGYASAFASGDLDAPPRRRLAVVTCMDARLEPLVALGLDLGDAHVMRNAGGVVTDDVIRSLCLSQRALGTREIVVIHHSKCGLQGVDEVAFRAELQDEIGVKPAWSLEGFDDTEADVRQSVERIRRSPFVPHTEFVSGFVYDVETGSLSEVDVRT